MECGWRFLSVLFLGRLLTKLLNSLIHGDLREESNWKGHSIDAMCLMIEKQ